MNNDDVVHFVLGSSIFVSIFPLIVLYTGYNNLTQAQKDESPISFEILAIALPIVYGILTAISYKLLSLVPRKIQDSIYLRYVIAGTVPSIIINFGLQYLGIHRDWLQMENPSLSYILVPLFYFIYFFTFGQWIRSQLLYGPSEPSKSKSSSSSSTVIPSNLIGGPSLVTSTNSGGSFSDTLPRGTTVVGGKTDSNSIYDKLANLPKA
jgi:hypothetical protein